MHSLVQEIVTPHTPESLASHLADAPGIVLLRSGGDSNTNSCYSFVCARPILTLKAWGTRCELPELGEVRQDNPWRVMEELMARFRCDEQHDSLPLGGCFGYWGYDLKNFVEPHLPQRAINDLGLPDCHLGFYDSVVVFEHRSSRCWIISTGLDFSGKHDPRRAQERAEFWRTLLTTHSLQSKASLNSESLNSEKMESNLSRAEFISAVRKAQDYIRSGDIYQVNLSHRLSATLKSSSWEFFRQLSRISPAPFSAFIDCGGFQLCSSSPELFLRIRGNQILTQPIKGTRPRSANPDHDFVLATELQTSPKERAELVMITDLLRNDLGKVCEFGSVEVPELIRLERFSHVQHLISTVTGRLKSNHSHLSALESCFPGGSITGAPKIRAMQIIDELEPITRGPYTGAIGYLGFNDQSQLSIAIRTAICKDGKVYFHVGAGIVADSSPEAEYDETMAKAAGFLSALRMQGMNKKVIFLNGTFVSEDQAMVSVADRGFLYGDGLFETLRVENGRLQHWHRHMERLQRGLDWLQIMIPFSPEQLREFARELTVKNGMPQATLRLTVSRGMGVRGYSPKNANQPTVVMTLHEVPVFNQKAPKSWDLVFSTIRVQKGDPLAGFKHANKLPQILARAEADAAGADEALLLNTEGELAEGTASNLFWIQNQEVFTPSLECGVLPGITRARVLELCGKNGIAVHEVCSKPDALLNAEGAFMSLTTLGVVEVLSIDKKPMARSPWVQKIYSLLKSGE